MSEQKYYVFQKSLDGKKIVSQLVRYKLTSEGGKFVSVSKSKSGRYENSFSEFTKSELAKIGNGALYSVDDIKCDYCRYSSDTCGDEHCEEWINPLIELVQVEGNE